MLSALQWKPNAQGRTRTPEDIKFS